MAVTNPSEFLRQSRQELTKVLSATDADMFVQGIIESKAAPRLRIGHSVPARYHSRMQKVWFLMVLSILCAKASREVPLAQRHQMLQVLQKGL